MLTMTRGSGFGIAVNEIQRTLGDVRDVPVRSPRWTNYPRGPGLGVAGDSVKVGDTVRAGGHLNDLYTVLSVYTTADENSTRMADLKNTGTGPDLATIPLTQLSLVAAAPVTTVPVATSTTTSAQVSATWRTVAIVSSIVTVAVIGTVAVRHAMHSGRSLGRRRGR